MTLSILHLALILLVWGVVCYALGYLTRRNNPRDPVTLPFVPPAPGSGAGASGGASGKASGPPKAQ